MLEKVKNNLCAEKKCTGGLLFLVVSSIIAFMLVFCVLLMKATMTRSVAESVEHTIALECLASCYIDPGGNQIVGETSHSWHGAPTFRSLSGVRTKDINPVEQFNTIMKNLHLMAGAVEGSTNNVNITYNKNTNGSSAGYGNNQATLTLQMGQFRAENTW